MFSFFEVYSKQIVVRLWFAAALICRAGQERNSHVEDKADSGKYPGLHDCGGKRTEGSTTQYKQVASLVSFWFKIVTAAVLPQSSWAPGPDPAQCFSFQVCCGVMYRVCLALRHTVFFISSSWSKKVGYICHRENGNCSLKLQILKIVCASSIILMNNSQHRKLSISGTSLRNWNLYLRVHACSYWFRCTWNVFQAASKTWGIRGFDMVFQVSHISSTQLPSGQTLFVTWGRAIWNIFSCTSASECTTISRKCCKFTWAMTCSLSWDVSS